MAQDNAQAQGEQGSWLTLSEAAERSGLHKEALRARAKRGQLQTRKNNRGELLILLPPELLTPAQGLAQGDAQAVAQAQLEQLADLVRSLEGELLEARLELARTEGKIEAAQAVTTAEVAAVQAEVAAKDVVIGELKAMLTEARRPFWSRWWPGRS
jgi:hypothetical protein